MSLHWGTWHTQIPLQLSNFTTVFNERTHFMLFWVARAQAKSRFHRFFAVRNAFATMQTQEPVIPPQFWRPQHISGWWFGCHFPINIGLLIIPIDELIFFRGVLKPPTRVLVREENHPRSDHSFPILLLQVDPTENGLEQEVLGPWWQVGRFKDSLIGGSFSVFGGFYKWGYPKMDGL